MHSIRWLEVQAKNAYSYKSFTMPLDQQGLVLMRGLNLDDGGFLGAGKTSPFEVFAGVQTGRVGKQRKGERHLVDDVVNLEAGQDYEARIRVEVAGRLYDVIQCRKHHRWGNAYRVVDVDTGRNIVPNASRKYPHLWLMRNLLQIDDKSFFNFVYLAQDFFNAMLSGTDGDRQQSIVQMFGLDVYDHLLRTTKTQLVAYGKVVQDVDDLKREMLDLDTKLAQFDKSLEVVVAEATAKRAEVLQLQTDHDSALERTDGLQNLLRQLEARTNHVKEIKRLWERIDLPVDHPKKITKAICHKVRTKADKAANKASQLRNSIRLLAQRQIIEQRLQTLVSRDEAEVQEELEVARESLRTLTNETLPKAEQRAEVVADLRKLQRPTDSADNFQAELDQARAARQRIESDLKTIEAKLSDGVCPTCKRPLSMEVVDMKAAQKQQVKLRRALATASTLVHDLSAAVANARRYEALKATLAQIGAVADSTSVQQEIRRLSREEKQLTTDLESGRLRTTLEAQLDALPTESQPALAVLLEKTEKAAEHYRRQYDLAVALRREMVRANKLPKGKISDVRKRLRKTQAVMRDAASRLVDLTTELAELEGTAEQIKHILARKEKIERGLGETENAQTEIKCLSALEKAFGSKGLKRDRFRAILRDAADQTVPHYMNLLWPKRNTKLLLAEDGSEVRVDLARGGTRTGSRLLSGGERNKAGLALLFGMRDLKEKYTALQTNLLIVDEPFGNLDTHSTSCLLRVLKDLRSRFGSIFVIGNQNDVLNSPVWDQVWWAVRDNQESTLYRDGLPDKYKDVAARYGATD